MAGRAPLIRGAREEERLSDRLDSLLCIIGSKLLDGCSYPNPTAPAIPSTRNNTSGAKLIAGKKARATVPVSAGSKARMGKASASML
jgi:hypothetical protein